MTRNNKGQFVQGNTEGAVRWKPGQSGNPAGKPAGTPNLMTIVKEFALKEDKKTGIPFFSQLLIDLKETSYELKQHLDTMSPDEKGYRYAKERYLESAAKLADFVLKGSGDYTTKVDPGTGGAERQFSSMRFVNGKKIIDLK